MPDSHQNKAKNSGNHTEEYSPVCEIDKPTAPQLNCIIWGHAVRHHSNEETGHNYSVYKIDDTSRFCLPLEIGNSEMGKSDVSDRR